MHTDYIWAYCGWSDWSATSPAWMEFTVSFMHTCVHIKTWGSIQQNINTYTLNGYISFSVCLSVCVYKYTAYNYVVHIQNPIISIHLVLSPDNRSQGWESVIERTVQPMNAISETKKGKGGGWSADQCTDKVWACEPLNMGKQLTSRELKDYQHPAGLYM